MLNVHLSLAVNQHMWEAVLTFNHLTQIHIVYIKSHQVPAKILRYRNKRLAFWTQFLKTKQTNPKNQQQNTQQRSHIRISNKLSNSVCFGFIIVTPVHSAEVTSTTGSRFNSVMSCSSVTCCLV